MLSTIAMKEKTTFCKTAIAHPQPDSVSAPQDKQQCTYTNQHTKQTHKHTHTHECAVY